MLPSLRRRDQSRRSLLEAEELTGQQAWSPGAAGPRWEVGGERPVSITWGFFLPTALGLCSSGHSWALGSVIEVETEGGSLQTFLSRQSQEVKEVQGGKRGVRAVTV